VRRRERCVKGSAGSALPTQTFQLTTMYRLLRDELEPLGPNPLGPSNLEDIYNESIAWMEAV